MRYLLAIFVLASASASAERPPAKPYTAICQEDMASGFSWSGGKWAPARFKSDTKLHIKRYSSEQVQASESSSSNILERPLSCLNENLDKTFELSPVGGAERFARRSCYLVKEFGQKAAPFVDAEVCIETYEKNSIAKVECKSVHFNPNGLFIRLPWRTAMDVSASPENDYKDSLSLAVGKCSSVD